MADIDHGKYISGLPKKNAAMQGYSGVEERAHMLAISLEKKL